MRYSDDVKPFRWDLAINDDAARDHVASATLTPLNAVFRGFWGDNELMMLTGIASVAVLKKLQATGAIRASYIALPEGGRRRAWSAKNAFRTFLAKEIAAHGRMSMIAAGALISAIIPDFLDRELRLNQVFQEITRRVDSWAALHSYRGQLPGTLSSGLPRPTDNPALEIVNWEEVNLVKGYEGKVRSGRAVAFIKHLDGAHPKVSAIGHARSHSEIKVRAEIFLSPILAEFIQSIVHA
jgi:hypothetical protein